MMHALNPKNAQVLIADDSADDALIIGKALETFGIRRAYWVDTAEEALAVLARQPCDVALVDYVLPKMNGLRLLERIRGEYPDTRVIFITGSRDEYVAAESIKHGAVDYLGKDELLTSNIIRALQRALRQEIAEDAEERARRLMDAVDRLAEGREESDWLLGVLLGTADRPETLVQLEQRLSADEGWQEHRRRFIGYLLEGFRVFPGEPARQEEALVRELLERGASPREVIAAYRAALRSEELRDAPAGVAPVVLLAKVLARLVEQYQIRESFLRMSRS